MKLNEKQLQQIKDYLNNKDVEYIDLHFEVLDHIASDIETKMETSNVNFEKAFEEVKEKWNKNFSYKWTFWLGIANGGSKLFINHCIKIYKPLLFRSIIILSAFLISLYLILKYFHIQLANFYSIYNIVIAVTFTLFISSLLCWRYRIKKLSYKTTYSYLFNKQVFSNIFLSLFLVAEILKNNSDNFGFLNIIFLASIQSVLFMGYKLYKNHLKAISSYKKYKLQ